MSELDPRVSSATIASGWGAGEALVRCDLVELDGQQVLLPKAHPGVIQFLSVAFSETRADQLRPLLNVGLDTAGEIPYQSDAALVFDYEASCGTAVSSAIVGVEAFTNHHLARYCPPGKTATYDSQIYDLQGLRNLTLDERVGKVLPAFYEVPRPTSEPWWSVFLRVQALAALTRHAVEEGIVRRGLEGTKTLVQRLCDGEYRGAAAMMLSLFGYFEPTWVDPERLKQLPPPP